jgi:hypothetical protein
MPVGFNLNLGDWTRRVTVTVAAAGVSWLLATVTAASDSSYRDCRIAAVTVQVGRSVPVTRMGLGDWAE